MICNDQSWKSTTTIDKEEDDKEGGAYWDSYRGGEEEEEAKEALTAKLSDLERRWKNRNIFIK